MELIKIGQDQTVDARELHGFEPESQKVHRKNKYYYHHLIREALFYGKRVERAENILGCEIHKARQIFEAKFGPMMHWGNNGHKGWHIDHIKPCRFFNLSKMSGIKECFNINNLQPLWFDKHFDKDLSNQDNWVIRKK